MNDPHTARAIMFMRTKKATEALADMRRHLDYLSQKQLVELYNEIVTRLAGP